MVRLYAIKLLGYRTHHLQTAKRRVLLPQRRLLTEKESERIPRSGYIGPDYA